MTLTNFPASKPRPSGEYATTGIPSSRAVASSPSFGSGFSMSSVNGEYSTWTAVIGCTACARRNAAGDGSESPRYLTFPSLEKIKKLLNGRQTYITYLTSSAIAATVSSMGTFGSTLGSKLEVRMSYTLRGYVSYR